MINIINKKIDINIYIKNMIQNPVKIYPIKNNLYIIIICKIYIINIKIHNNLMIIEAELILDHTQPKIPHLNNYLEIKNYKKNYNLDNKLYLECMIIKKIINNN